MIQGLQEQEQDLRGCCVGEIGENSRIQRVEIHWESVECSYLHHQVVFLSKPLVVHVQGHHIGFVDALSQDIEVCLAVAEPHPIHDSNMDWWPLIATCRWPHGNLVEYLLVPEWLSLFPHPPADTQGNCQE